MSVPFDDHEGRADRGITIRPTALPLPAWRSQLAGQEGDPAALGRRCPPAPAARTRVGAACSTRAQVAAEFVLVDRRDQRRDRLLPEQRDDAVEQREAAGRDQQDGASRTRRATRARAGGSRGPAQRAAPAAGARRGDRGRVVGHRCLSSQSRLRTPERSGAGIGHRAADRDLDAARSGARERRRAARASSGARRAAEADAPEHRRAEARRARPPRAAPRSMRPRRDPARADGRRRRRAAPAAGRASASRRARRPGAGAARARRAGARDASRRTSSSAV